MGRGERYDGDCRAGGSSTHAFGRILTEKNPPLKVKFQRKGGMSNACSGPTVRYGMIIDDFLASYPVGTRFQT